MHPANREMPSAFQNANPMGLGLSWEIRWVAESLRRFARPGFSVRKGTKKGRSP